MNSESARLRVPVDIHEHNDPNSNQATDTDVEPDSEAALGLDAKTDVVSAESGRYNGGRLWRENGLVMYQDAGLEKPEAVRLVWVRPLSGRGGPVSVMMAAKKKEVAYLSDISVLPEASRAIAMEELKESLVMPVIREIVRVNPRFGNFYWDVETDMGRRKFLLLSPESNTFWPNEDAVILRDVSGNCYEITSIAGLNASSRRELERVL